MCKQGSLNLRISLPYKSVLHNRWIATSQDENRYETNVHPLCSNICYTFKQIFQKPMFDSYDSKCQGRADNDINCSPSRQAKSDHVQSVEITISTESRLSNRYQLCSVSE